MPNIKTPRTMNKRIFAMWVMLFALLSVASCNKDDGIDPSAAEPTITYAYDSLEADLNVIDNLPIVAVVKSEAGLRRVTLRIRTTDGEMIPVTEVTEFFNRNSYSLSEDINYASGYEAAVIEAVDLLDRKVESSLPITIIDVVEPPMIVFNPTTIEYDEMVGGEMPRTHIEVTSTSTLASVELYRVKESGQELYTSVTFTAEDPQSSWTFDELVQYDEFDKGLKVKAVDNYGQIRIETLSVQYKTVPPPVVTFAEQMILADKDEEKAVNIHMESQAGIVKVELYRLDGVTDKPVKTTTYDRLKTLDYAETMVFTNATKGVRVVVTDNVGRTTTAEAEALVNLYYETDLLVNTAVNNDGVNGGKRMLSLSDRRTYSVQECLDDPSLQSHVDVKVYYMNGTTAIRIYNIKDNKNNEYKGTSGSLQDFDVLNDTRFKQVNIDFDTATAADIAAIDAATIQSTSVVDTSQDGLIGVVLAVKLANTSPMAGKVALLKLVSVSEYVGTNKNARTFNFALKLPKE